MEKPQVVVEPIKVLRVTVVRGKDLSVGISDIVDTPDPYVILRVTSSPTAKQRTSTKNDNPSPEWNESFTFCLNPEKKNTLQLTVKDEDIGLDDLIGKASVEIDDLPMDETINREIRIKKKSFIYIKMRVENDLSKELRFSNDLCEDETEFVKKRKQYILEKMKELLTNKKDMPKKAKEVPTIAVIGSGGGYRAACGLSGVFCALEESGILDCATYVAGLSGSSWYISTLYSNEGWPHNAGCHEVAKDLRKRFDTSIRSHFHRIFARKMREKRKLGQPVTFTDLFGMAIGDALLQNNQSKFSNQIVKLESSKVPLPICTALRVRKTVSALTFSEWVEFSPYEFGMTKYGVFGKMSDFGAKFYKGRVVEKFEEPPLHFMQGIWGSAFSILLNRVIGDDSEKPKKGGRKLAKEQFLNNEIDKIEQGETGDELDEEDNQKDQEPIKKPGKVGRFMNKIRRKKRKEEKAKEKSKEEKKESPPEPKGDESEDDILEYLEDEDEADATVGPEDKVKTKFWLTQVLKPGALLKSRQGKAAEVLNVFRGLTFKSEKDGQPIQANSPGKPKTMCLVDSGLAFNSPYPAVIRPERGVELILSFDFTQREGGDNASPFEAILMAEEWAKANNIPFPPIADNPVTKDNGSGIRECYVFENPDDPMCPTILHFVLVNKTFKEYVTPEIPRVTNEEKDFGNFSIFDDPAQPYSTFTFQYNGQTFDRLHELMKFNTLLNVDLIKEKIVSQVQFRRKHPKARRN